MVVHELIAVESSSFSVIFDLWYDFFLLSRTYELKLKFRKKEQIFKVIAEVNHIAKLL